MKICDNCKWADWRRTSNGRLHPDKTGRCTFVIRVPVLPLAFRWGYSQTQPNISGGFIQRKQEFPDHCPMYSPAGSMQHVAYSLRKAKVTE